MFWIRHVSYWSIMSTDHYPQRVTMTHDDVIKWKHFPRYWPFVRGIHRSPVNSPHKGQWRGALMSSLICVWINGWVNDREAGDLRRYRGHYDVIVMRTVQWTSLRRFQSRCLLKWSVGYKSNVLVKLNHFLPDEFFLITVSVVGYQLVFLRLSYHCSGVRKKSSSKRFSFGNNFMYCIFHIFVYLA